MADITWTQVVAFAPKLSTLDSGAQDTLLAWVNAGGNAIDPAAFGGESSPTTTLARIYLAAHAGTMSKQGGAGAAGPVVGKMAGGVQVQYATPSGGVVFDSLDGTAFGKMYRMLCRTSLAAGPHLLDGT